MNLDVVKIAKRLRTIGKDRSVILDAVLPETRRSSEKHLSHVHIGEEKRSIEVLQKLFNPWYAFQVNNSLTNQEILNGYDSTQGFSESLWRLYTERIAPHGIPINPLFLQTIDCFLCTWLEGGETLSPFFDSKYYLLRNHDVRKSGVDPLSHWLVHGALEFRKPSLLLEVNRELASAKSLFEVVSTCDNTLQSYKSCFLIQDERRLFSMGHKFDGLDFCECQRTAETTSGVWCAKSVDNVIWSI